MENSVNRPPSGNFDVDSLSGSLRKRKSTALNQPGATSESDLQYYTQLHMQNTNFHSGAHIEGNTRGLCFNQVMAIEPTSLRHQFEKNQFPTQNVYSGTRQNGNGNSNFHGKRTDNVSNTSSHMPPQPLEYKGSFDSLNMQAEASVDASTWQTQVGPNEANKLSPFLQSDGAHRRSDQVASSFEERDNKFGVPFDFRQSSNFSNNGGINDFPSVGATSSGFSLCLEQLQNLIFSQNGVKFCSSGTSGLSSGNISENGEQVKGDGFVKSKEGEKASDVKNLMHPLPESLPQNSIPTCTVENGQKKDQAPCSPISDESKSQSGRPASTVAEKLWDGSVQLSSSVVVSAVAFFKSGEKLLDTNWSEAIEVKGKVRLEAFEKYIRDLPRSRSRGLMVISLCWKEGSSETGLAGMKEVAKGYKRGAKVGRAPLSPGIDLYICPRSDAVITILAKYGFFKGMAAVEDNPDSMIGCVVWRKNQTPSNSIAKKPESKSDSLSEKHLNSPSLSPLQQAVEIEKHLPVTQPTQDCAERSASESKKQIEINISVPGPEQPKTSLELQKPVTPFSLDEPHPKETTTSFDVDDLPEFDFRAACGISQTTMTEPLVSVLSGERLPAKGIRNKDRSVLPGNPNLQAISVSGQNSDHSILPLTAFEGIPSLKKLGDREPQIPVFRDMEERSSVKNKVTTTPGSTSVFPHPHNIFDDDDDMPEWCPPERRSLPETTNRSATFSSETRNPPFQTSARGPPQSVPFSPSPNAIRPPFSPRGFPPKAPEPRSLKRGTISSKGSDSDSILGPPPSFNTKVPFYPAEKRKRPRY